ncbi:MAG: T9SS type A sorting domain-containing protein, partial [Cyclobacteriaceae bacterium]|nr:T9SS type A sorting domain-containing protein [Cyclobacteriaceae bacterium]
PVPILTPVVAGVNNTAFCSNVNAIDLRTNNSSTITDFSFGLAQPDITTSNPNDVVPAPDPNNIVRPHPSLNDRFQLVPQNSLPLWSGTDFNPKDRLLYYAYQDAKGCNDTTALSGPGSLQVRLNHQPPAPTITGGADICVVNGTPPTSAVISDALSSTDPVAPNPVTSNLFAWFNNSALTGSPVSNNRSFTPGLDPTVNQTVALFAVQTINNCQSPTTNVRYLVLNAPQFTWNKFFIDATPVNFSVDLGGLQSFISKIDWSIKNRTGATVSNQTVNNPAQVSSIGFSPSNPDVYATTMTITSLPTQGSCSANKSNNVVIVGSTTANASTTYDSKFANSDGGWLPVGQNVSWEFGSPGGAKSILGSTNVWITKLSGAYNNNEFSYLYTPYFDITGLTRPLISFKSWIDLDIDDGSGNKSSTGDGVVLQYSTDSKVIGDPTKIWKNLGTLGSGVDWFNKAFLTSNPAAINGANNTDNPNVGWGGSILTDGKVDWLTPKFVLDNPRKEGTNVVFRFAFASGTASLTGSQRKGFGFAIDSVRIGNRTRTILYENFTNKGSNGAVEKFESDYVRNNLNSGGIGTQVVKLNYHVDFPAPDPFNQDNPADPSSRALYYGVNSTPASRLDGSDGPNSATTPNEPFSKWGIQRYNIRTLQLGQAFITIKPATGNSITANGKISVSVDIRPTVDLPPNTVLHIAVVEQSIPLNSLSAGKQKMIATGENQFDFVVKKMIPSAAGTITGALKQAVTKTFGPFEWVPDPIKLYPPNTKNLAVIAFLQNEKSGVIYQAEIVSDLDDPATNVITGLEPIPSEQIVVFPNPANKEFTILLPGELSRGASVRLIDQVGKTAVTSSLPERSKSKTINTQDLSPGMYILQIETGPGAVTRKKVMVVHED